MQLEVDFGFELFVFQIEKVAKFSCSLNFSLCCIGEWIFEVALESEIDLEFDIVTELSFHIWNLGTVIAWLSLHRVENSEECFALFWLGSS